MEAGMSDGPAFGGWQHCHGGIRNMLIVNVVQGGFYRSEALFCDFII
jgi:hypothetical protein